MIVGAHVHGQAKATLVLDNDKLNYTITIPAYDLLGFEHVPNNKEQESIVQSTIDELQRHKKWLGFNADVCTLNTIKITNPFSGHHKKGSRNNNEHKDFEIIVNYLCKNSKKLKSVNVFTHHINSKIETIELQWLAHNKQSLIIIKKDQQEVVFYD
ncbi:MAG: DUF2796 domain-containing protein [Marinicellaceae bacterium]